MASSFVHFVILSTSLFFITGLASTTLETAELINSVQSPMIMTRNFPTMMKSMRDNSNEGGDKFCQIEYQVTRKRTGKCVKLSHGINGCISGEYIDPFHPHCF